MNESWFGLFIDDWTEVIPNIRKTSGVAFHFDDPGAGSSAGTVLLAVPPVQAETWDLEAWRRFSMKPPDLAQIRAVDLNCLAPWAS